LILSISHSFVWWLLLKFKVGLLFLFSICLYYYIQYQLILIKIQGYRIRLHFDGYSDSHDFWLNADSENLFHCGWCEKNGQKLRPPKHYDLAPSQSTSSPLPPHQQQGSSQASTHGRTFSWPQYLKFTSSTSAPRHLFISAQNEVNHFIH
jgi:hypothetical protein